MRATAVLFTLLIVAGAVLLAAGLYQLIDGLQRGRAHAPLHALKYAVPGTFLLIGVQNILPDTLVAVLVAPLVTCGVVGLYLIGRGRQRARQLSLDRTPGGRRIEHR